MGRVELNHMGDQVDNDDHTLWLDVTDVILTRPHHHFTTGLQGETGGVVRSGSGLAKCRHTSRKYSGLIVQRTA